MSKDKELQNFICADEELFKNQQGKFQQHSVRIWALWMDSSKCSHFQTEHACTQECEFEMVTLNTHKRSLTSTLCRFHCTCLACPSGCSLLKPGFAVLGSRLCVSCNTAHTQMACGFMLCFPFKTNTYTVALFLLNTSAFFLNSSIYFSFSTREKWACTTGTHHF